MEKSLMLRFTTKIVLLLVIGNSFYCTKSSSENPIAAIVASPPVLASVTPQIGTPAQNNPNATYGATEVVIRGEDFGLDPVIRFNEVQAIITANFGTELYTRVPDGAYSGLITVSKSGGSCLPNEKTGTNCTGTEFFVDCYSVTNKQYGPELELKQGSSLSVKFDGIESKAIRTTTLTANTNLTITCESILTVRVFDRSCRATDYALVRDPTILLPANVSTQFYVTAGSATCNLSL
ncbi:MAG: hypothetical protein MUF77_07570 [Leptospira sp.]|nr:hypothetical protein [Leptospira sp.]